MEEIVCCSCGDLCERSVRHKNQCYCPKPGCQRARKAAWKRYKMRTDPDYRFNQRLSSQTWAKAHPGYWSAYRAKVTIYYTMQASKVEVKEAPKTPEAPKKK
jgi:hypothetical protein